MTQRWKRLAYRAGMIGMGAAALAACETTSPYAPQSGPLGPQPNFPIQLEAAPYTPDTVQLPPSQQPPASAPAGGFSTAAPAGAVQSQPLAPLGQTQTPQQQAYVPPRPPGPPPAPVFRDTVTGSIVDADGPASSRIVRSGDTLSSIAREMGATAAALARQNDIDDPSRIQPGQRIEGPPTRGKAYVVQSGDTLSAIGRRFNVTATQLATANNMGVNDVIRPNQRVMLPAGYRDTGPVRVQVQVAATPSSPAPAPIFQTPPTTPSTTVSSAPPAPRPAPPLAPPPAPPAAQVVTGNIQTLGRGKFAWPVDGRVTGNFGSRGVSQQSDGIDIAASEGSAVHASAAGTVMFAGPLADFGNLVLIDHGDNFFTAYAHLGRIDVDMNDTVRQGENIASVGRLGADPGLYFEMRHRETARDAVRPFDPMLLLPAR